MTLYEKIGRRYKPVSDTTAYDGLSNGAWLVIIEQGRKSMRRMLAPEHAEVEAAIAMFGDALTEAIVSAHALETDAPMTKREKEAWLAFREVSRRESLMCQRKSISECVEAALAVVRQKTRKETP